MYAECTLNEENEEMHSNIENNRNKKSHPTLDNKYKIVDLIMKNNSNKVVLAVDTITLKKYAIKIIPSKNFNIGRSILEKQAIYHKNVSGNSPNLIELIDVKIEGEKKKETYHHSKICHYLVLEFASHGEIYNYVRLNGGLYHGVARYYFRQLINGIEAMHNKNVCHRDIKLDNILLDENFNLKISDFEFCQEIRSPDNEYIYHTDKLGTYSYMAPEFFNIRYHPFLKAYKIFHTGDKVDIFAAGVVLFIMLTGFFPFSVAEKYDKHYKLFYEKKYLQFWENKKIKNVESNIPDSAKDLLNKIFEVDPEKRITIKEIKLHKFYNESVPTKTEVQDYMNNIWLMVERDMKKKDCN